MRKIGMVALGIAALGLAGCGGGAPTSEETTAAPASEAAAPAETGASTAAAAAATSEAASGLAAAPAVFAQCAACHSVKPGVNGVGPSLVGVFGRKSGGAAGYAYSDANKNSGLTWDEATLDEYLTAPMKKVPGTKMAFAGIADAAKRKEVIAYLKTLK